MKQQRTSTIVSQKETLPCNALSGLCVKIDTRLSSQHFNFPVAFTGLKLHADLSNACVQGNCINERNDMCAAFGRPMATAWVE